MKQITIIANQSLCDISLQEYGTMDALFSLAALNGMSITDDLTAGKALVLHPDRETNDVNTFYRINQLLPATAIANVIEDESTCVGGIGCMQIEVDFVVSGDLMGIGDMEIEYNFEVF